MDLRQDGPPDRRRQTHVVQIVTTEHYNLQSARSLAASDANGRAALFLGTVSGTLIALAFVGNVEHAGPQLGATFFVFAFVLFPALVFLELAPQVRDYLIPPSPDDAPGLLRRARW